MKHGRNMDRPDGMEWKNMSRKRGNIGVHGF
jgi:hypothetical protein